MLSVPLEQSKRAIIRVSQQAMIENNKAGIPILTAYSSCPISGIDFKIKTVELRKKKIKLQIWDTAGQERFHTITTSYYRGAMGIMLVYDISNEKSFENIVKWLRNIDEHANEDVEKMILGNKCDMEEKRVVTKDRGEAVSESFLCLFAYRITLFVSPLQIAREHGIKFMETSAKANINIERAFCDLAEAILDNISNNEAPDSAERVVIDRKGAQDKQPAYKNCCA